MYDEVSGVFTGRNILCATVIYYIYAVYIYIHVYIYVYMYVHTCVYGNKTLTSSYSGKGR